MWRSAFGLLAISAIVGWPSLAMPFRGDTALYLNMASEMDRGAVLYRDVWDITNPGIFWFDQLAGTLFGFDEEGVRTLEWIWWTGFAFAVSLASKRAHGLDRLPLAPAVLISGVYYFTSYGTPFHLTKVEGLAGFPIVLAIGLAARASGSGTTAWRWWLAAGAAGGVVVLFKFLFVAALVMPWCYLLWRGARREGHGGVRTAALGAGMLLAGTALALAPAIRYFAAHDAWNSAWTTLVEYPRLFLAEGNRAGVSRLALSAKWFLDEYSFVGATAVLGAFASLRGTRDPCVAALALFFPAAIGIILVQRASWWSYHFLLLGIPASALAAYTWPALAASVRSALNRPLHFRERGALALAAIVLCSPWLAPGAFAYFHIASHGFGLTPAHRRASRESLGTAYEQARSETAWLREPGSEPGPIFVAGNPSFYAFADRRPATAIHGWSLELYPRTIRDDLTAQLKSAEPVYIYVNRDPDKIDDLLRERYPAVVAWMAEKYVVVRRTRDGVWYGKK